MGKGAPSRKNQKRIALANLSEHLADLDLSDGEEGDKKPYKFIDVKELNNAEFTFAILLNPDRFNYAYDVFFFLGSWLEFLPQDELKNTDLVRKTIDTAVIALRQIAESTETQTAKSVVHAATDFKYPEEAADFNRPNEAYFIIIEKLQSLPEERDYFARQVAEVGILARATLVQNKASQQESGDLDEAYVPCARAR